MIRMWLFVLKLNFLWRNPYVMSYSNLHVLPLAILTVNNTLACHVIQLCFETSRGCL
jgi:hypothetical protein